MNSGSFIFRRVCLFFLVLIFAESIGFAQDDSSDTSRGKVLEEVYVNSKKITVNEPVGSYGQPGWSTTRRFPSTRVYLQVPKGAAMYEKWMEVRNYRQKDKPTEIRMRDEFAFGLGKRLELDLYLHTVFTGTGKERTLDWRAFSWELRYALADWNKIFGNPTLYFEYLYFNGDYAKMEPKLLLGGNINQQSIWGLNLIYERQIAPKDERDEEYAASLSYGRIFSNSFSAGISYQFVNETEREAGVSESGTEHLLGPSLQIRFHPKAYLDVEPLFGLTEESKRVKTYLIFGWTF